MQIRPAIPADAALLAQLGATTFYDTFAQFHSEEDMQQYLKKAYAVDAITQNLNNPDIAYFIAEENGEALGYTKLLHNAAFETLQSRCMELEKIYVQKAQLGAGVGKELMQHAIAFGKAQDYQHLVLGVWQENHRAVNFYNAFGFKTFATRTFQLGQSLCDDYLMQLDL